MINKTPHKNLLNLNRIAKLWLRLSLSQRPISGAAGMIKIKSFSKKALISLLIITVLAFGLSQADQEAAPGQPVTGQITLGQKNDNGHSIEISPPEDLSGWTLEPGIINEQKGILHVKAKGGWQIKVSADKATNGYMTEYIFASDNGKNDDSKKPS